MKEMFIQTFGTPLGHPKSKPFIDRTMSFMILDNKIWIRNYQIVFNKEKEDEDPILVEIDREWFYIQYELYMDHLMEVQFIRSTFYKSKYGEKSN